MTDIILAISILVNAVAILLLSKRISIVHERISLICEANGLWGKEGWIDRNHAYPVETHSRKNLLDVEVMYETRLG